MLNFIFTSNTVSLYLKLEKQQQQLIIKYKMKNTVQNLIPLKTSIYNTLLIYMN